MASTVKELRDWLAGFDTDQCVWIDKGGLSLIVPGNGGGYYDVGGEPEDDDYDDPLNYDQHGDDCKCGCNWCADCNRENRLCICDDEDDEAI